MNRFSEYINYDCAAELFDIFKNKDNLETSKELINLLYLETVEKDMNYTNEFYLNKSEPSSEYINFQNSKPTDVIRNMTNYLQDIIFSDYKLSHKEITTNFSNEISHLLISDYIEKIIIRPLFFISNNIIVMKNDCRGNGLFLIYNLITFTICIIYNYYTQNIRKHSKHSNSQDKDNEDGKRNYRRKKPFLKPSIKKEDLETIKSFIDEIKLNLDKNYDNLDHYVRYFKKTIKIVQKKNKIPILHKSTRMTTSMERYSTLLKDIQSRELTLINLLTFSDSDKNINFGLEILKYLHEKIYFGDENTDENMILNDSKFLSFSYFNIMSTLFVKCNTYFQKELNKDAKDLDLKYQRAEVKSIKKAEERKMKIEEIENAHIPNEDNISWKDYKNQLNNYIDLNVINIILFVIENFKHHQKDIRMIHYTQLEIINNFITYSCEGSGKFFQNLYFDEKYQKFVTECWCWILLIIIDLVEEYDIQNSTVINLANNLSTALLSIYQDTDKDNIVDTEEDPNKKKDPKGNDKDDGPKLIPNTIKLFKKASKVIFSDKIFKSDLISTYINLITLSKMIPNVEKEFSTFFETVIFPVKKCLSLINNFIKIFYKKCERDKLLPSNYKQKKSVYDLNPTRQNSLAEITKDPMSKDYNALKDIYDQDIKTMTLTQKQIDFVYEKFRNDLAPNSIYNSDYFKISSELYLYLNLLKTLDNANAMKYLSFNADEDDSEEENDELMEDKKDNSLVTKDTGDINSKEVSIFDNISGFFSKKGDDVKKTKVVENITYYFFSKICKCVEFNIKIRNSQQEEAKKKKEELEKANRRMEKEAKDPSKMGNNKKPSPSFDGNDNNTIISDKQPVYEHKMSINNYHHRQSLKKNNNSLVPLQEGGDRPNDIASTQRLHFSAKSRNNVIDPSVPQNYNSEANNALNKTSVTILDEGSHLEIKEEKSLRKIYFISNPICSLIRKSDIKRLLQDADRSAETGKIISLLDFYEEFQEKINFYKEHTVNNLFLEFSMNISYFYVDLISFIFVLMINFIQLVIIDAESLRNPNNNKYNSIIGLSIGLVAYNIIFFFIYCFSKQKEMNYLAFKKAKRDGDILTKTRTMRMEFYLFFSDVKKFPMVINIVVGSLGIINPNATFLFSLSLLTIAKFFETTRTIIRIFQMKFSELLSMVGFLIIITYAFTNIGYYFLPDQFENIPISYSDQTTNVCQNLISCFVFHFNNSVRVGGGVSELLNKVPYSNLSVYVGRWFFDLFFFIIINLMLLNMVNGVIITPFGQIREENDEMMEDVKNRCFICSIDRSIFQQHLLTFEDHKKNSHNIMSYIEYLVYLSNKLDRDQDFDEKWIKTCIDLKDISCFPIKKALDDEGKLIEERIYED